MPVNHGFFRKLRRPKSYSPKVAYSSRTGRQPRRDQSGAEAMFRVFNCLSTEHDWRLVILAGIVCFLASVAAVSLFHRARATAGRVRATWLVIAGVATGCGIWATHFIAMLAYEPGVATAYDIGLTALSFVAAAVVTCAGLSFAVCGRSRFAAHVGGAI